MIINIDSYDIFKSTKVVALEDRVQSFLCSVFNKIYNNNSIHSLSTNTVKIQS